MRPILFTWNGTPVYTFRVCLTAALLVFVECLVWQAERAGLPWTRSLAVAAVLMLGGVAGARLLYVVSQWAMFRTARKRIFQRGESGAAMFGGMLVLYCAGVPMIWLAGLPLGNFLDMIALATMPAIFLGRVGCLMHGCCSGRATEGRLGMRLYSSDPFHVRRLPMPLLEMAAVIALEMAGLYLLRAGAKPGTVFVALAGAYSLWRYVMDSFRAAAEAERRTLSQQVALVSLILNIGLLGYLSIH